MLAVEVTGLTKQYGRAMAVNDLQLAIRPGEAFGLLGPNGAGKTTTIRMLITLLEPTAGDAKVWGYSIRSETERVREVIGYIPQERALDRYLTGLEHLALIGALHHLSRADVSRRSRELLELVGLTEWGKTVVRNYSGGMKKRLEIACGLINHPKILFLDEPTLGLDPQGRILVWQHLRELQSQGMTILLTTNYLDEADQLCDRLAIMDRGRVLVCGTPLELKRGLGGDFVTVRLGVPELDGMERAAQALKALGPVQEVSRRGHILQARVTAGEAALSPIIQCIKELGVTIETIQYSRPDLEAVFLHYTGRSFREE